MSNDVKKPKKAQKSGRIEIAFVNAVVEKGGKILDEMLDGKKVLEYTLHEAEMSIKLSDNGIDKDGNRFDPETKYIISIKGNKEKPKTNRKANLGKSKNDEDLAH